MLFCLDADTGKEHWRMPTDLPVWGMPAVQGEYVYAGIGNGNFLESAEKPAGAVCVSGGGDRQSESGVTMSVTVFMCACRWTRKASGSPRAINIAIVWIARKARGAGKRTLAAQF